MGLFGTLAAVGAVGAAAGLAWRWAQHHRGAGAAPPRDLSRWEGEGGALANVGESVAQADAQAQTLSLSGQSYAQESPNGAMAEPWPFPSSTRH